MRTALLVLGLLMVLPLRDAAGVEQTAEAAPANCRELSSIVNDVGARLKKRFQIDPRVGGCVSEELDTDRMSYRDLQGLLALRGFIDTMELDGVIQIVPDANARHLPVRLIDDSSRGIGEFEMVMKIVDPAPLEASQVVPMLRPLLPQYAHLVADSQTNSLIVVTRYAGVRTLETLLRALRARPLVPAEKTATEQRPSDKSKEDAG
jgi:general secretion pathway protein D